MASNRARLLSSRQRQRYRARHNEKLRQVKAEREREGKIADVMFGVEQTLRANRAGQDAAQVGLEALGKITTLMQDTAPRRPPPQRSSPAGAGAQLPPLESPTRSPNKLAATYPAPGGGSSVVPSRPESTKFRAQNPLYGRDTRFKAPSKSHSLSPPPRPARAAWGAHTGSPLAPVARPTDLTRPSADGARPHYVLTRRMKPSLLKPLSGSGGRRRRRRRVPAGGFNISPPRFTGPPRRAVANAGSPKHQPAPETTSKPEPSPRPEVPATQDAAPGAPDAPVEPKGAPRADVAKAPAVQKATVTWSNVKRVAMRVGGHLVLVRVCASGAAWPMRVAVSSPRGAIAATAVMSQQDVAGAVGHDVSSPAAVASNAHLLRAVVTAACPAAAVSTFRTCRRVGGRALAIHVAVLGSTVRVSGIDHLSGDNFELQLAATDAGWLLGESTAASRGGLDQRQLARLSNLVTVADDGSTVLRRVVTSVAGAQVDGAGDSASDVCVCVEQASASSKLACAFVATCAAKGWSATMRVPLDRLTVDVSPDGGDLVHAALSAVSMLAWHQPRDGSGRPALRIAM